jgi:excisionase family DNA binding protein
LVQAFTGERSSLLTTGEVAKRVGVSRQTVINWVRRGLLPGFRLGGRTMIAPAALERFAEVEGILDALDAERPPVSPQEAAAAIRHGRRSWTWPDAGQ